MGKKVTEKLLDLRPENALARLRPGSRVLPLNSLHLLKVLGDKPVIMMACNTRIKHVIPGIMEAAEELDAVVGFELAKSEGHIDGGYTGMSPDIYSRTLMDYAQEIGFTRPFYIHGDHITVKNTSEKEIEEARKLIAAELSAGYTSFAIDASFNQIPDNIRITTELAGPILDAGIGLEVEVGEIKSAGHEGEITTVAEAVEFIDGLKKNGIFPQFLAINNGSKHGNYLDGEEINIDLERTEEIYRAIAPVVIAQHGVTGTPLHLVGRFADFGIRKANVGTHWQNIAHAHLPEELMREMKEWAEAEGKSIKMATKPFKERIDSIPQANADAIRKEAYETAKEYITAFRADGTASLVIEELG